MSGYLKTADADWFKTRVTGVMLAVLFFFTVLLLRLFHLQIIEGEEYRRLSDSNSIRLRALDPPRGLIFDRGGELMVDNRPSFDLSVVPKDAGSIDQTIEKLSAYAKTPKEKLMARIGDNGGAMPYRRVLLKQDIGRDALAAIEVHRFELPGIVIDARPVRHYVSQRNAAHLIGYLGEIGSDELASEAFRGYKSGDYIGRFGVEKTYEKYLRGKGGGQQVEVNAVGQIVRVLRTVDAQPGYNVHLTLDKGLQQKAEDLLGDSAGAVIAMEPSTGHILVLASSPSFDQNVFVSGMSHEQWSSLLSNPLSPLGNKAFQGEYPPASVYKMVTAIAGLEEGVVDEKTTFNCPGFYKYGDRVFRCWKKGGHGTVDVVAALAESCDFFFYQVGERVGIDLLAKYAGKCGFGSPTGIRLDHELEGLVPTRDWKRNRTGVAWLGGDTLSAAIGQGFNLVTPLQVVVMTSALANGGTRYRPTILQRINTAEGDAVLQSAPDITGRLPVTEETLALVKKGMWEAVNAASGTAWTARIDGMQISGKTGTAQVVSRKEDEAEPEVDLADHLKPHAWFTAFAPRDDPLLAVTVIVENGGDGARAAAPIAKELFRLYLSRSNSS